MYAVERLGSYITRGVYTVSGPFHPFGGAVDMIVVEQQDGSFKSSPWYVRFGKFQGVLKAKEKVVNISVNGVEADFHMYLDHKGEAYFLKEVDVEEEGESLLYPSSSGEETDGQSGERRPVKTKSCDCDAREELDSSGRVDASNGKILARTGSRRSRLLGLVFGRKSMKENNLWEEEGGPGVVRALERAEIAADLLEVQWCTNLATKRPGKDKVSQLSAADSRDGETDKSLQITGGECQIGSTVQDSTEKNPDQPLQRDLTGDFEGVQGNDCEQGSEKLDDSVEETSAQVSCKSTSNTAFETSSGGKLMEEQCEVISVLSRLNSQTSDGDSDHYEHAKSAISQITSSDLHPSGSTELGVCPNMQLDGEEVLIDREALSCNGVSVETEVDIVQSFAYCETSDCLRSGLHSFDEQTQETVCISQGECREVHAHAEVLLETAEILSGVNSSTVSDLCVANETCNNLEYLRDGDNERILESEVTSKHFITSDFVETEVLEVYHQDVVIEGNAEDVNVETKVVEVPEEPSQRTNPTVSDNVIPGSVRKTESRRKGTLFSFSNMVHQIQDENDIRNENDVCEVQLSEGLDASPCESSEEEQFLFSDVDDLKVSEVQFAESISWDGGENVNHPLLSVEVSGAASESCNRNHESDSYSEKSVHENLPNDTEELVEKSRKLSSPIEVPGCHMVAGERALRLVESLPNLRSHIDELEANNLCHSSQSLDLDTKSLRWALDRNYAPSCIKSDADEKNQLAEGLMTTQDFLISGELNKVPFNSAIEVSLCKHLLYEGMGADAASKAFDAEKLDVDKFSSLGPAIVKNDRLVVRINGHYFPWEVAAPIVLGMVSFGSEYIFKPKGMIPVDRVQKNHEGDPSNAIIASGGSWRIWPFSFKRSRTMKGVSPGSNGRRSSDVENSPDGTYNTGGNRMAPKAKDSKKKVRAITPTTEQLASLNLKEGRNTVTFTFSTAMLGKQEIDARIFVWKWNTRIVISDVDGTITKSDVLGQFMPLVGMDWSHIGVAHLFSAIKENGYQLLFLSARAIVQAYHTRQFLFNLKQDGKALPDGPVLISPNGLFPSLYREVIRRAPHEFKIACLEDIRALFPPDCNPFYAGFGNRDTDEISYLKVGIPKGKIFIINPKGEVAVNRRNDTKSYTSLHTLVNGMFPPMSSTEQEDFNSWNYWKLPPPVIDF